MKTSGSRDGMDGNLEAGYPAATTSTRGNGYPFKRNPVTGRSSAIAGDPINGFDKDDNGNDLYKGGSQLPSRTTRSLTLPRGLKSDGESGSTKGKSCICSILISVVLCCFLAEALLQGSVMLLWKQSDFSLNLGYVKPFNPKSLESPEKYSVEYKLRFEPSKLMDRVSQKKQINAKIRISRQGFLRPPYIAVVSPDLDMTPESLYILSVVKGLQSLGYKLQVYSFKEGPMQNIWKEQGVVVEGIHVDANEGLYVDWSKYEGVLLTSLNAKHVLRSLMQEPFDHVPVIWTIFEDTLGKRLSFYEKDGLTELISEWKQSFKRADVVVFPDYTLAMMHTLLDTGNFLVIPGSAKEEWDIKAYMSSQNRDDLRKMLGLRPEDVTLTVVGSPFIYKGIWREHAMILKSVFPISRKISRNDGGELKLFVVGNNPAKSYGHVVQVMASHLGFKDGSVSYFNNEDSDVNALLWAADIVIYSSLRDEQEFPSTLLRAIGFRRFIVAPNLTIFQQFLKDDANGAGSLLYPVGDFEALSEKVKLSVLRYKSLDHTINEKTYFHANQLVVQKVIEGYADLLESIISYPSDSMLPRQPSDIPSSLMQEWHWESIGKIDAKSHSANASIVFFVEHQTNKTVAVTEHVREVDDYEILTEEDWFEQKATSLADDLERQEEEQLEERHELLRGSWEDVYKVVKKMDRLRNELHERDDGELERTGQPLCIYEPYFGMGAAVFVHQNDPLYRAISMVPRQRRLRSDDIDASLRLSLLNETYYREVLCEFGAFFTIANHIDRVHKNSWIGFQSWRAHGRKVALSLDAEDNLRDAVRTAKHGDALYFWTAISQDDSLTQKQITHDDFWSFCDLVNNNNCRSVFTDVFRQMYGLPPTWDSLPNMPVDGGKWSHLHCWVMPTASFLEFVMFSRMFVDALDSQHYTEHHDHLSCCLGSTDFESKHCYCRMLELLVNVWAYHSARPMVYVDPKTGIMQEQHSLDERQGHMWVKFFSYSMLKGMDEDLAEEMDDELHSNINKRRLWPRTGEVFWQGVFERERQERYNARMERKRKNKERLERIRSRYRQKPLAGG